MEQLNLAFDEEIIAQKQIKSTKTCRTCTHCERWQCGGSAIQYCNAIRSNRTFNKLKKIKCTNAACLLYAEEGGEQ